MIEKLRSMIVLWGMLWQVVLAKITRFPRPVSVNYQITKRCNLSCPYCFADMESLKDVEDSDTEGVKETIDELYKYGCRHIILMGGEPLCRRDIGDIIRYIRSKWMRCEIVTNGYFVKDHIDDLKLCDSVCVSLDGPAELNDKIRGKGCHDKVIEALELLKAEGARTRIHTILTKVTYPEGPRYVAEIAKKYGVPFNVSMVMLRADKKADFMTLSEEQVQAFLKDYRRMRDEGYPVFSSNTCLEYMEKWPKPGDTVIYKSDDLTPEQWQWVVPCNYGRYNCFVDVDDRIYKCCLTWKNGFNWREVGMKACLEHIGKNLINCVSCRSIGDIDRALLLNFSALSTIKMVWAYMFSSRRMKR